jgi:multidrug efflux pump subunit AcrB
LRDNQTIKNAALDVSRSGEEFAASRTRRLPGFTFEVMGTQQLMPLDFIDVRQPESGKAVGLPVAIRISGDDARTLREKANEVMNVFRTIPEAARPREDWGDESFTVKLQIREADAELQRVRQ